MAIADLERQSARQPEHSGLRFPRTFTREGVNPYDEIEWERRDAAIPGENGNVFEQAGVEVPKFWSMTATNVVASKYFRGKLGTPARETSVRQMIDRVVDTIARWGVEGGYFANVADAEVFADELRALMVNQYASFNSPVWFNIGVPGVRQQASACQPYRARVSTPLGPIPIGEIVERSLIGLPVYDSRGIARVQAVKANGVKRVYRVELSDGLFVEATADHLVSVAQTRHTSTWSRVDELSAGMRLRVATHRSSLTSADSRAELIAAEAMVPAAMAVAAGSGPERMDGWAQGDGFVGQDAEKTCAEERHERIVSIMDLGEEEVFDIQTTTGEYLSNNVVVHNCFILSVDDSMDSILDWFKTEGVIFKGGSGSGINVSTIRSSKEHLSGGGLASGPVSFMRGADSVAGSIKSGGTTRRAAKMVVLNSDHPDIREFIWCKAKEEKKAWALGEQGYDMGLNGEAWQSIQFQNANNSVRATDDFMRAALADEDWSLRAVSTGDTLETVKARALLREISEATWACGDPGMQFDTTINDWHTCPVSGRINGSNPCSEYMHVDDSACNLASLNLMRFVRDDDEFDAVLFARAVDVIFTAQEILVGFTDYPTPKITRNAMAMRQLGLGYANLGALLMSRGLAYDSDAGRAYAAAITATMTGEAYAQSARIAQVVGAYDAYDQNRQAHDRVMEMHRLASYRIREGSLSEELLRAARAAWDDAVGLGREHGYRNAQATVLAPTGTISFMMDCDTTGVEPDIALVKYKRLVGGGMLKLVNGTVPAALRKLGYTESESGAIATYIEQQGTIEGAPALRDEHLTVFDCAFVPQNGTRSIGHLGHIQMMGAVQPFISGAISKTVNLPETATPEDVMDAYVQAWKHGVKAIAIYRDGSKKVQPLSTGTETSNSVRSGPALAAPNVPQATERIVEVPRPRRRLADTRASLTHKFTVEGHEGYITVGLFDDGTPGEIFVTMAKEGSTLSGMMDSFATSVSLLFQYGVPLTHLVEKFGHTRFEPSGWTGNPEIGFAKSIVDYVFRWLGHRFLSQADKLMLGLVRTTELVADPAPQLELMHQIVAQAPAVDVGPGPRRFNSTPDAPPCPRCGWLTVRNGTCHKCENCGETTGCS